MTKKIIQIVFYLLITTQPFLLNANTIETSNIIDDKEYILGNKNLKHYEQVPKGVLIFSKAQAIEPNYIWEPPLRGYGKMEAFMNKIILELRKQGNELYVDYFTSAKYWSYLVHPDYEICVINARNASFFSKLSSDLRDNNYNLTLNSKNKFHVISIPYRIQGPITAFGILTNKLKDIEKYKFDGTEIYNVKLILDDTNLYTANITETASAIRQFIYNDQEKNKTIKPIYKKRIYDFVASNLYQTTLMLKGKRMHWVDLQLPRDYFLKQFNIPETEVAFREYSVKHPSTLTLEDRIESRIRCTGKDLKKLKKVMSSINRTIKKYRTNLDFWIKSNQNFFLKTNLPYVPPEKDELVEWNFKYKRELDAGNFDNNTL